MDSIILIRIIASCSPRWWLTRAGADDRQGAVQRNQAVAAKAPLSTDSSAPGVATAPDAPAPTLLLASSTRVAMTASI